MGAPGAIDSFQRETLSRGSLALAFTAGDGKHSVSRTVSLPAARGERIAHRGTGTRTVLLALPRFLLLSPNRAPRLAVGRDRALSHAHIRIHARAILAAQKRFPHCRHTRRGHERRGADGQPPRGSRARDRDAGLQASDVNSSRIYLD